MSSVGVWVAGLALAGLLAWLAPRTRPLIGRLALVAIGLVFVAAAFMKAIHPEGFTETVRGYGLLPGWAAPFVTYTLIPLEMALGAALLLDFMRRAAVTVAVVLLAGFLGLIGYTAATGGDVSECGCFGSLVERTAAEVVVEDLAFMALALLGLMAARERGSTQWLRAAAVGLSVLAAAIYMPFAAEVPVESLEGWLARSHGIHLSLVTRLVPGRTIDELHVSVPDAALAGGGHLVALLDLEQEEISGAAATALNELAATQDAPAIAVLYANEEEVKDAFFWSWAPSYPMYRILPEEMRGLHRRLPRFFLVEEGVVQEVWDSLPDAEVVVASMIRQQETRK